MILTQSHLKPCQRSDMTTPSSTSAPTLAARVDPPPGISAAVQALEARCDTWAPVAFPPGNRPKLTKEAQLCDQVTGGSTYPTVAFIDGVITGIFAGDRKSTRLNSSH